jgi:hypothetical protein
MHRLIVDAPHGVLVDHRDGDGLNNTRANLRLCSNAENMRNSGRKRTNTSGFKGVIHHKKTGKWVARITVNDQEKHLGLFPTREAAARAYDDAARRLHGAFALTNFGESA